jgi:arginine N-succinyltransferase
LSAFAYHIRGVTEADLPGLADLARHLDSVNLPADDPATLEATVRLSERSFAGQEPDPARCQYVFVIEHAPSGRLVGTSSVMGQVGRRDAPHIYFDVRSEERYSATLDRHFRHSKLQIGFSYDGPTALGGLVVAPEHRRTAHRVGSQISLVRFLFIAMHRARFRDRLVAELLPPLAPDGTSHLWEAVGRHFTGLSYREADRLSKNNKEFIRGLFPDGDIYMSLLPLEAQRVVGQVGPGTLGVARLLARIGFRYAQRVDPFDGGPYYEAATDQVAPVRQVRRVPLLEGAPAAEGEGHTALVAADLPGPPWFRAVVGPVAPEPGGVRLGDAASALLDVGPETPLGILPWGPSGAMPAP